MLHNVHIPGWPAQLKMELEIPVEHSFWAILLESCAHRIQRVFQSRYVSPLLCDKTRRQPMLTFLNLSAYFIF